MKRVSLKSIFFVFYCYEIILLARGLGLKKKLLLPILLLFKLKSKILMPIFVALIGLKATKALILSKLAILIVIGFIVYQFIGKSGKQKCNQAIPLNFHSFDITGIKCLNVTYSRYANAHDVDGSS